MPIVENRQLEATRGRRWSADLNDAAALLRRARGLLDDDRLLIEMAYAGHLTRRQIGQATGVPAGTVTRRLQRVVNRLRDPIVSALLDDSCPLATEYRQLGLEHFLQGLPIGALADLHRMKRADVADALAFVRGWHGGLIASVQRNWRKVSARE